MNDRHNPFFPSGPFPQKPVPEPPAEAPPPPPFEKITPKYKMEDLVFPPHIVREVEELLEDFEFAKELDKAEIPLRRRILFHGPSGCGKTSIAHALALKLDMPLYYNSLADTLSSYMGESEKNIAAALEFTHQNRCVMLFDEFDSIASKRIAADHTGGNESNRLVNMLLVGFDQKEPKGILVACTNLFDLKLEIPAATEDVLRQIASKMLKSRLDPEIDTVLRNHRTPSDITKACQAVLRRRVIEKAKAKKIEIPVDGSKRIRELSEKKI